MIVKLPGGRDVIIDCKTCLDAFLEAAAATDEDTRRVQLQRHAQQVRARARELAAKSYWSQFANSPEYVVMFLPGDAFLYAAAEHDTSLVEDCIKNSVIIATPTTLIALLKVIEFGWRQEAITENAEKIRELGTALYDRIATVLTHMNKIGTSLTATVNSYNSAVGSLESRVLVTARKMSELSGKPTQEMVEPAPVDRLPREVSTALIGVIQPALFEEVIETENAA
jgi:DNA recombination protein RmuC